MPIEVRGDNVSAIYRALEAAPPAVTIRRVGNGWHLKIELGPPPVPFELMVTGPRGVTPDTAKLYADRIVFDAASAAALVCSALDEYRRLETGLANEAEEKRKAAP